MEDSLFSQEDVAYARRCGVEVFFASDPAFAEKCRKMNLPPPEDADAFMLEYDLREWFLLAVVSGLFPFGAYMCMEVLPGALSWPVVLGMGYVVLRLVTFRQRIVFTERLLYIASYGGLWWTVRRVDAAEDMRLYPYHVLKAGTALRLATPAEDVELLATSSSGLMRDCTAALFSRWQRRRKARARNLS